MWGSHNQVYGGGFVFQSQSVWAGFDGLEVLRCRCPSSISVEKILFGLARETVFGNLIFLESALVADASTTIPEIEFTGGAVTDGANVVFLAQRFHWLGKFDRRIDFP